MKRTVQVGGKQSGKTAAMKKEVATAKKQGKRVSVVDPKKKPYSNQYGSWDGIRYKKARVPKEKEGI